MRVDPKRRSAKRLSFGERGGSSRGALHGTWLRAVNCRLSSSSENRQYAIEPGAAFDLAFPDFYRRPSDRAQLLALPRITKPVVLQLPRPKFDICLALNSPMLARMRVPKATVNEQGNLAGRES